jgi:thiol:disulfide interchange protein
MKQHAWKFLLCFALAAFLVQAAEEHSAPSEPFLAHVTLDAALKKAAEQKKIVLVDFYTTWCGPCQALDRTTWKDPKVVALLKEKAICLKIDAEKEEALAQRFKVEGYPTILLLDAHGSLIKGFLGYRDASTFLSEFKDALGGKTSQLGDDHSWSVAALSTASRHANAAF